NLFRKLSAEEDFKQSLEILSSLSQRTHSAFDAAGKYFADSIDLLVARQGSKDASAIESILSASPDVAMRITPALLTSDTARWQEAGVRLLRAVGTDEALDKLVQLLEDPSGIVRYEAASALSSLIKDRGQDLVARASLLPERTDETIWPLNEFF